MRLFYSKNSIAWYFILPVLSVHFMVVAAYEPWSNAPETLSFQRLSFQTRPKGQSFTAFERAVVVLISMSGFKAVDSSTLLFAVI